MDRIVRSSAVRNMNLHQNRDFIEQEVITRTHGFRYKENFRRMLIHVVGVRGVEIIERSMDGAALQVLRSTLGSLKTSRDAEAHTHLHGVTRRLDAPSATIRKFDGIYDALTDLQSTMKEKGF